MGASGYETLQGGVRLLLAWIQGHGPLSQLQSKFGVVEPGVEKYVM